MESVIKTFGIASIFSTIQGEGLLSGVPMTFLRLAGCSVGCPLCDTDYRQRERLSTADVVARCNSVAVGAWVWVTGGEPTDWIGLDELQHALKAAGFKAALATAGVRQVSDGWDFVSVSPHSSQWVQRSGTQLNIVPSLNGLTIGDLVKDSLSLLRAFDACYVTPCDGKPDSLAECVDFVMANPRWRLGAQSHKAWGMA